MTDSNNSVTLDYKQRQNIITYIYLCKDYCVVRGIICPADKRKTNVKAD